jgi:hypothetical protein
MHTAVATVKTHALIAATAAALVCTAIVVPLVVTGDKSAPIAAPATPSISPSPIAKPVSFDLASFDWRNASVPGDSCFDQDEIALHDGTATLTAPAPAGNGTHFILRLTAAPAVGVLASGRQVAVLSLECEFSGYYGGVGQASVSYAVYDAKHGAPHLLGIFGDPGVGFGKHGAAVRNGTIDVTYSDYRPNDPSCCPSGPPKTTTIRYRSGGLFPSWPHSGLQTEPGSLGPAATQVNPPPTASGPTTPATTEGPSTPVSSSPSGTGFPRAVRLSTYSETGGPTRTIPATLDARDRITGCATHSYGSAMIDYFRRHPCQSATRRLYTIRYHGREVALSWITVVPDPGTHVPQDGLDNAATFSRLENAPNTGSIDDLLREGARPAGWPTRIPPDETFSTGGHGGLVDVVEIFDAWYLAGSNTSQDPSLLALIRSLYFTS